MKIKLMHKFPSENYASVAAAMPKDAQRLFSNSGNTTTGVPERRRPAHPPIFTKVEDIITHSELRKGSYNKPFEREVNELCIWR